MLMKKTKYVGTARFGDISYADGKKYELTCEPEICFTRFFVECKDSGTDVTRYAVRE